MRAARFLAGLACAALSASAGAQVTQRVSLDSSGAQTNLMSLGPVISADGRYVAFYSHATNLVPGDTNGADDVFVRDRVLGTTERLSVDAAGVQGNGSSDTFSISAGGRYVAFDSLATNLVPGDTNGFNDVFLRDRSLGTIERVSVGSTGGQGNGTSYNATLCANGRLLVFTSSATNLVAGDSNGFQDVFFRDLQLGTTERVSLGQGGLQGNGHSAHASSSRDGRHVVFQSRASNLVGGDTNGLDDVFVRDRLLGTTERLSVGATGSQVGGGALASISDDGRFVAFQGTSGDLVVGDTNGVDDIFVRDRQLATTQRVSLGSGGIEGDGQSEFPSISAGGRFVTFRSTASNLVPGDTNGTMDVFVRDLQSGTTERLSLGSAGEQAAGVSYQVSISDDGRVAAFLSTAENLVGGDTNGTVDVFVRDRFGGPDFETICDPGIGGVIECPCSNPPAGSGRGCDNSASTGGAVLSASGGTYLSSDSLVFTTSGETPNALSILAQGGGVAARGMVFGQGVSCAAYPLRWLYVKNASAGSITAPNFAAGDARVSQRSAALGDPIQAGESRSYFVYYRDPIVLGGCPPTGTFNTTQTGRVSWSP